MAEAGATASHPRTGIAAALDAFLESISDPSYLRFSMEGPPAPGFEERWVPSGALQLEVIRAMEALK